jgi:hypothetical protein
MGDGQARRPRQTLEYDQGGILKSDELRGRLLLGRVKVDVDLPFDERVERERQHINTIRIVPAKHERMQNVLGSVSSSEVHNVQPLGVDNKPSQAEVKEV